MHLKKYFTIALFLFLFLPSLSMGREGGAAATLNVEISGFKNSRGKARVCLFDSEKGFPLKQEEAFRVALVNIANGRARVEFSAVPTGTYAVSVLHDVNGNGRMDTNTFGLPKEGVGSSNNPRTMFGPPDFKDARFTLGRDGKSISITIFYPPWSDD